MLGARTSLTAHTSVVLGDDVWCGQDVFVSDASHGYQDTALPIGRQLGQHQPVVIGSGTIACQTSQPWSFGASGRRGSDSWAASASMRANQRGGVDE